MPRERIQHGRLMVRQEHEGLELDSGDVIPGAIVEYELHPDADVPKGAIVTEQPSLDVHWNRDGEYVQLAIDAPRTYWQRFLESYEGSPEATRFGVFTDRLTRSELNHLIRTLRRARDAAYGADA